MISYSYWLDGLTGVNYKLTWLTDLATQIRQCVGMQRVE